MRFMSRMGSLAVDSHSTSATLIERLRSRNDQQAWQRFVALYSPLLLFWARKIGLSHDQAADLVQDVCLTLMQKLPEFQYDSNGTFRGWLRTIAINKGRDQLRKRARDPRPDENGDVAAADSFDDLHFLEEAEYREHLVRRAMELMRSEFQPKTWQAAWEHTVNDRSAADVAAELGISENAVFLAKSRVMKRLRTDLVRFLDD